MRKQWLFVTIVLVLCLVRCTQSTPSLPPAATDIPFTETPTRTLTLTPSPTVTPFPSKTPTPEPLATPTPDLTTFESQIWSTVSPDGQWSAQTTASFPTSGANERYYTQLTVSQTDGSLEWVIVDAWEEMALGYTIPQVLQWSPDGRYVYFTNRPLPDGCAVFVNGLDLHRFDLSDGSVTEIVPPVGLWLSLSPDETTLAYIGYADRGLVIRDLATGTEREMPLSPGPDYQAGRIVWSPDGAALVLTLALRPCTTNWADATSIVYVNVVTMEQTTLLAEDPRLFITAEWASENQVLLRDNDNNEWLLDVTTGHVTPQ